MNGKQEKLSATTPKTTTAPASWCLGLYRHEVGHIYGIFIDTDAGGLMGSGVQSVLSDREKNMFGVLYSLPHGAHVSGAGTWQLLTPGP